MLLMNFPQLCYQFKDLVAFSVAEFEFDKNQAKPWVAIAKFIGKMQNNTVKLPKKC